MKIKNRIPTRILSALVAALLSLLCFSPTILAAGEASISLNAWDRSEALNFSFRNIVPGDSEMKEYAVKISDIKASDVQFRANCPIGNTLADALCIKVLTNGDAIYDGPLSKMGMLSYHLPAGRPQTVLYNVTIYMPTTVTSDYAGLTLNFGFSWSIARRPEPVLPPVPTETTATSPITTMETTTETTTAETTTEIITEITTTETTATETTTVIVPIETTTEETTETTMLPLEPPTSEHCCECCVGYYFPFSCNFRLNGGDHCDLFWCCNEELGIGCWCPWCWILPILLALLLLLRSLFKKRFGAYCDNWIEQMERVMIIDSITLEKHKNAVDRHIKPQFGRILPKKLTPQMTLKFEEYLKTARLDGITPEEVRLTWNEVLDYCHKQTKTAKSAHKSTGKKTKHIKKGGK